MTSPEQQIQAAATEARAGIADMIAVIEAALAKHGRGQTPQALTQQIHDANVRLAFVQAVTETVKHHFAGQSFYLRQALMMPERIDPVVFANVQEVIATELEAHVSRMAHGLLDKANNAALLNDEQGRKKLFQFLFGQTLADFSEDRLITFTLAHKFSEPKDLDQAAAIITSWRQSEALRGAEMVAASGHTFQSLNRG